WFPSPVRKNPLNDGRARLRAGPAASCRVAYGSLKLSPIRLIHIDSLWVKLARTPGGGAKRRLEGWPLARSRLWSSFETRAILRGARPKWGTRASDRMSLSFERRLTLDAVTRVARIGRVEPQARKVSHGRS